MSTISASTTNTTAYTVDADTTGNLTFKTGSSPTTAMTIDTSQNVGIGTSSPTSGYLLDVRGRSRVASASNYVLDLIGSGTNASTVQVYADNSLAALVATGTSAIPMTFYTGASERMRIDSSGNVGIGTSSPGCRLDVAVTDALSARLNGGSNYTYLQFGASATASQNWHIGEHTSDSSFRIYNGNFGAGTERMRIDSSGNLLVATTSSPSGTNPGTMLSYYGALISVPSANVNAAFFKPSGAAQADYCRFIINASQYGAISWNGTTGTLYTTTSDYRLKENVQPMVGALAKVAALKPCTYTWKPDGSDGQGFIAHELQQVIPDAVSGSKDAVDADGNPQYQGIDTSFLVATLTAAIQELKADLDATKAELAALKGAQT